MLCFNAAGAAGPQQLWSREMRWDLNYLANYYYFLQQFNRNPQAADFFLAAAAFWQSRAS